jgi:hypothetical protein
MTEQRKILKRSDIVRTITERATDKFQMMIFAAFGACVPFLVMLLAANWIWREVNLLLGFLFGIIPCAAIPILLIGGVKLIFDMRKKKHSVTQGDVTVIIDTLTEVRKCTETYYSHSTHTLQESEYDVFEFARGNTFTMKEGLWTESEKNRARDKFGVGQSFILVIYQKKSWELQMIYPEALYEYVDDTEG